jgi:hypothetical protein
MRNNYASAGAIACRVAAVSSQVEHSCRLRPKIDNSWPREHSFSIRDDEVVGDDRHAGKRKSAERGAFSRTTRAKQRPYIPSRTDKSTAMQCVSSVPPREDDSDRRKQRMEERRCVRSFSGAHNRGFV